MSPKLLRALFILTFGISAALRLGLSLVNREANDPHMEVVTYILQHNSLPTRDDCWECFQPKLYHLLVTGLIKAGNITSPNGQILAANLFSFTAGLLTLAVIWRFLAQLTGTKPLLRWLAFSFTALNPKLIGISSQATNDALLILFSTLALYQTAQFLKDLKNYRFALLTGFAILAASTKTNGWVTFIVILLALLIRAMHDRPNRLQIETGLLVYTLLVPLFVTINPLNQYLTNYREYGTPLVVNINRAAPPRLFTPTDTNKPGLLSIQDGFFTFKLGSLLATPYINPDPHNPLPHRTSFWTQLYGRAHSTNFDNWPASWRSDDPRGFPLRRAIYLLALIPTALLLAGTLFAARNAENRLFALAFLGYLGFTALYAFTYREYPVMKAIFIYPALPAFPILFISAAQKLPQWTQKPLAALSGLLFILYCADVLSLTTRLFSFL